MAIYIALASILAITAIAWLVRRFLKVNICPICAGVAGTWLWLLVGMLTNQLPITNYQLPAAILMGGSVVGIAYQTEKRLPANRSPFLWKTLFIPSGLLTVYGLASFQSLLFSAGAILTLIIAISSFWRFGKRGTKEENEQVKDLEDKMKNCC